MSPMRTLSEAPVTQSTKAIVELLNFLGKTSNPLPEDFPILYVARLSFNKKDVFYITTANSCSCPSAAYRPGQKCKHQRLYFPGTDASKEVARDDMDTIRPSGKWPGGFNGPVDIERIKAKTEPNKAGA